MAFLPGNRALVTEKKGQLLLIENGKLAGSPITGLPPIDTGGQAGLFDVMPHPDFAKGPNRLQQDQGAIVHLRAYPDDVSA